MFCFVHALLVNEFAAPMEATQQPHFILAKSSTTHSNEILWSSMLESYVNVSHGDIRSKLWFRVECLLQIFMNEPVLNWSYISSRCVIDSVDVYLRCC